MTRESAKAAAAVINAWADGKTIQIQCGTIEKPDWRDLTVTEFDYRAYERYRIKPEPREWWLVDCEGVSPAYSRKSSAELCDGKIIHVREVL